MINLLKKEHSTISCDKPSLDDHEPEKLFENISWISESFVKPPCELILKMKEPIILKAIRIKPKIPLRYAGNTPYHLILC